MTCNYTSQVREQFITSEPLRLAQIAEGFMCMPLDTNAATWQKKLEEVAQEFRLSCRFCLMRNFRDRAKKEDKNTCGFSLELDGKRYDFQAATIETAAEIWMEETKKKALSAESETYLAYMQALAGRQQHSVNWKELGLQELKKKSPEEYEKMLIEKAWAHRFPDKDKLTLTRKEAFQLGHMLQFTQREMEFFLLRVFDYEEGFRYETSNDLIETYCLRRQKSWLETEQLKKDYDSATAGVAKEKPKDRNDGWTGINAKAVWQEYKSDDEFLKWMKERSPGLNGRSQTALRLYRNLAAYCFVLSRTQIGEEQFFMKSIQDMKKFRDLKQYYLDLRVNTINCTDLRKMLSDLREENKETKCAQDLIMENGIPTEKKCYDLALWLRTVNWFLAHGYGQSKQKSWSVPTLTDATSKLSTSHGPVNMPMRMKGLLMGSVQVEKSDLLFLLWVIFNLIWYKTAVDREDIARRIQTFINECDKILEKAMLPRFYVPHLLERTMLLAIVRAGEESFICGPAYTYEQILNMEKDVQETKVAAARKRYRRKQDNVRIRKKDSGYHFHPRPEWLELVKLSRTMLEYTKVEFATVMGVSTQSLDRYERDFIKKRELPEFDRKKEWAKYKEQLIREGRLEEVMLKRDLALAAAAAKKIKRDQKKNRQTLKMRMEIDKARDEYLENFNK